VPGVQLTLAEASNVLCPYIGEDHPHAIIKALHIEPAGTRRLGKRGRPHDTYDYPTLLRLHAAISQFLT